MIQRQTLKKNEIAAIFSAITCDPSWSFAECTTKQTTALTHGYHKYPAKFIPPLAARLIAQYTEPGDFVVDPFMGSGTTLVEAMLGGRRTVGVDINPIAWLISKAKTTPIEPEKLHACLTDLYAALPVNAQGELKSPLYGRVPKLNHERIDYWFIEPNRSALEIVLFLIQQEADPDVRYFMLCGFSNILKNCSRWLMRSSKPTVDRNKKIPHLVPVLKRQYNYMEKRNVLFWKEMKGKTFSVAAHQGDARELPVLKNSIDLVVTSPPYVTSYEYADLHQLGNLVLGFTTDIRELRKNFIGSVQAAKNEEVLLSPLALKTVEALEKADRKEGKGALTYFQAMQQCLQEMQDKLRPGGHTCIVIGNTTLKRVPIPNAEIFVETGLMQGFQLERLIRREIPSKILPQTRDPKTGRFTSAAKAKTLAYPEEYIIVLKK